MLVDYFDLEITNNNTYIFFFHDRPILTLKYQRVSLKGPENSMRDFWTELST
jgi:hypothetical protein